MRKPNVILSHKILLRNQLMTMYKNDMISQKDYKRLSQQIEPLIAMGMKLKNKYLMLKLKSSFTDTDLENLNQGYFYLKNLDIEFMSSLLNALTYIEG